MSSASATWYTRRARVSPDRAPRNTTLPAAIHGASCALSRASSGSFSGKHKRERNCYHGTLQRKLLIFVLPPDRLALIQDGKHRTLSFPRSLCESY